MQQQIEQHIVASIRNYSMQNRHIYQTPTSLNAVLNTIHQRKLQLFGHICCTPENRFQKCTGSHGTVQGTRCRG